MKAEEYNYTFNELITFALQTIEHFVQLKERLIVRTKTGNKIKPVVFPSRHMYIQREALKKIKGAIMQTEIFRNLAESSRELE